MTGPIDKVHEFLRQAAQEIGSLDARVTTAEEKVETLIGIVYRDRDGHATRLTRTEDLVASLKEDLREIRAHIEEMKRAAAAQVAVQAVQAEKKTEGAGAALAKIDPKVWAGVGTGIAALLASLWAALGGAK